MAAKVVMVAVPTVMGIASIRVYTVSQVPTDGLVTREKLNIYTPLPQSAQAQFVPERPGAIQTGFTTVRESILPCVQAVKGACVSVKTGSVNLYHAGEDVYYYLKDPPPGFLPRFGTITMAGLLGMFLARKGSRFQRLAIPLGLMSGGASVCYPAQTVAVFKVTGKNVYAVGQWSSATVSSLLASTSQEPVAKEIAASQPQTAKVPNPESAVVEEASEPSSTIPETEVESAEFVPVSDEPAVAVITEEASSVTLKEISPDQTPTETTTVAHSVPAETDATTTSEEIHAPVESEEPLDSKQAAEDVSTDPSPAEPTPSLESAPVEATAAEAAPIEASPVVAAAVEASLVEAPPAEASPVEAAPVEAAEVEAALIEASPVEPAAVEAAALEASPVEAAPLEAAPVEAAPVEAAPAAPVEATPVEAVPVEAAEVESVPSSGEAPALKASEEPEVAAVESPEPEPAAQELADPQQVAAVEETPTPTLTTPPPPPQQQPATENSKGGSGFKPDPSLMDFGQSSPEDEDLYSTRS
ncbi:MICOS complex subunit MIC27 isoform X2 [Sander lucioperca]|uniref:MICOS complex subunit MIC27 isoform X2 n=1 Tax=Sander lucioperca TaxID=283035 RepID=UPI0016539A54|nr:MICOS complex subunit MIC27 isoform X2 [Sander lucioperca]